MARRSSRALAALAAVLAGAVVAAFLAWDRADQESVQAAGVGVAGIEAEATLAPRVALFGDTVHAHVDVILDASRVDPSSVRIAADFTPFEVIGRPERRRQDAGKSVLLRTTFVLRCLTGTCVPSGQSSTYDFSPARIAFAAPGEQAPAESSISAALPSVRVYSRFTALQADTTNVPWRVDLLSLPAASYRLAPGLLVALLLAGATLMALAGFVLAYVALPRRRPAPAPEPEPEPPPDPVLSPLEQALALLERAIRVDGAAAQRRALELVAEELELAEWGDRDLARMARALAWSEDIPAVDETSRLAAHVRSALPQAVEASGNGDGRVD